MLSVPENTSILTDLTNLGWATIFSHADTSHLNTNIYWSNTSDKKACSLECFYEIFPKFHFWRRGPDTN